eukprot:5929108-Prymnesium_polylepis.1
MQEGHLLREELRVRRVANRDERGVRGKPLRAARAVAPVVVKPRQDERPQGAIVGAGVEASDRRVPPHADLRVAQHARGHRLARAEGGAPVHDRDRPAQELAGS